MSNISGFGAMRKKQEEEEKRQELYAGGVDNRGGGSGLSVLGPPSSRGPSGGTGSIFDNIVERAANPGERGEGDEAVIGGANSRSITLYRNGFTIDDGPLRDLTSPESREFITRLERGEVPPELQPVRDPNAPPAPMAIDIQLHDKRGEDYVAPPPPAYIAFSGTGVSLASVSSSSSSSSASSASAFTPELLGSVDVPGVDAASPSTTIQVLVDGKKLRIKINQNRTVLQLAAIINRDAGFTTPTSFTLSAGFPPKELSDHNATISEANLGGASVTVKKI